MANICVSNLLLFFLHNTMKRYAKQVISARHHDKRIAKHGMPKMRFHDLRHSCASLLLANGVPLKQIQEWLGHSDFSTTANIYAHLDYRSKIFSAQATEQGMLLPRSDDFGSRWENVTEQGEIT